MSVELESPCHVVMQEGEFIYLIDLESASASEFSMEILKDIQQKGNKTTCVLVKRFLAFDDRYVRA